MATFHLKVWKRNDDSVTSIHPNLRHSPKVEYVRQMRNASLSLINNSKREWLRIIEDEDIGEFERITIHYTMPGKSGMSKEICRIEDGEFDGFD